MRRLTIIAIAALLTFAACGDDEEEPATGPTGTAGATGVEGASAPGGLATAGDYMDASIPDQGEAVQEIAEADPGCEGIDTKLGGDFQVSVAIDAASASPDTPLSEIVNSQCAEN
jgi:hypothetical protein